MSFRENLQHMRAAHNMTQEQLAMLLGVSRQSVTKWESEKSYPEMDKLLRMCQIFDCTLDELVQGDLTGRPVEQAASVAPGTPPVDVVGYDEHMRGFARKVSTGVFSIVFGVALSILFFCAADIDTYSPLEGLFSENVYLALGALLLFAGVGVGLAMLIPGGMGHSAFVREHPYVEDFYTQAQKEEARKHFSWCLVGGIMCILGRASASSSATADTTLSECVAPSVMLVFIAVGAGLIVYGSMMYGRMNIANYNRSAGEVLEAHEIESAPLTDEQKRELLQTHATDKRIGAICGCIMIIATIAGLVMLFVPTYSYAQSLFWLAWPIGGPVVRHRLSAHEGLRFREIAK